MILLVLFFFLEVRNVITNSLQRAVSLILQLICNWDASGALLRSPIFAEFYAVIRGYHVEYSHPFVIYSG